jgi:hypothetical protein
VDLDVAGSTDLTRDDAVQAATAATSWCQAYQGAPLKDLTLDCATLSELVRLHILTSGGRCGERSSKWRFVLQFNWLYLSLPSKPVHRDLLFY